MNKEIWLIIYLNNEIYGSLSVYKNDINFIKKRYSKELSSFGKVKFKLSKKEPFHGW